jgi:ubiquinone/menaquinone biosynthesis C-methylase UbiE
MSTTFAGHYPIEHRKGEIERLHIQAASMAPDTRTMLDLVGVTAGWHCLDIGCGPRGITDLLSERVGAGGGVCGLDKDEQFIGYARAHAPANAEFRQGDAYATGLPDATFDFVHMRFVASTAGNPEALLREAIRLARPGGTVALQEPDVATFRCDPAHPAWDRLMEAMLDVFASVGSDIYLARRLQSLARAAGLADVHYRPFLFGIRSTDPMSDHLPATTESVRGAVLARGLISEAEFPRLIDECRRHLRDPGTVTTSFMVAQVWGRKPLPQS